jgi:hypothetical protein
LGLGLGHRGSIGRFGLWREGDGRVPEGGWDGHVRFVFYIDAEARDARAFFLFW